MKTFNKNKIIGLSIVTIILFGCKKFVEVDPPITSTTSSSVYEYDGTAAAVMTALISQIGDSQLKGRPGISGNYMALSLSADELVPSGPADPYGLSLQNYYKNDFKALYSDNVDIGWQQCYQWIYTTNAAIEGLTKSISLTPIVKQHLLGEAKFLRAFINFNLVNIYGGVPLVLSTDYQVNSKLSRTSKSDVYKQIVSDLKEAQALLDDNYLSADVKSITAERVRPNKWAATALLARAYLYNAQYDEAATQATSLIENTSKFSVVNVPLNDVFLKNSLETIWAFQPTGPSGSNSQNTDVGKQLILLDELGRLSPGGGTLYQVYLSDNVMNSFEAGDRRKSDWTGFAFGHNYAFKYKVGDVIAPTSEYLIAFRLAEQYLIRAEARAQLGDFRAAAADLNVLRARARAMPTATLPNPLPPISETPDKASMLKVILHERQVELFTEWGHRWFDLIRFGDQQLLSEIAVEKGTEWSSFKSVFPIPQNEIIRNPILAGQQNAGY